MSLPQLKEKFYTIDDIYALSDGERAELINGQIYNMTPPSPKHQSIILKLATIIDTYIESNDAPCKPFIAPYAVFLEEDIYTYVEPDISVICDPDKLTDKGCNGAPDWIIEVVSPSSRQMDYYTKPLKYQTAGVREYWIIDPMKSKITIHNFETEDISIYTFNETIKVGIFENLLIDFKQLSLKF